MVCNHEGEYWTRSASLIHTEVDGSRDARLHPRVRVYMVNGARHGTPSRHDRRTLETSEHAMIQLDARPVLRALLTALDQWVSQNSEPLASRVPTIDCKQLLTAADHRSEFPRIPIYKVNGVKFPALRHPGVNLRPPRVDFGPRFWIHGIQDFVPPKSYGLRFVTLVPATDRDGNPWVVFVCHDFPCRWGRIRHLIHGARAPAQRDI